MSRVVIRSGWVVCPTTGIDEAHDVWVEDGRLLRLDRPGASPAEGAEEIDASGCVVLPGAIDVGTVLRDPGREDEESLEQTLRAAAAGGYTTVVAAPGCSPCLDRAELVAGRLERGPLARGADLKVSGSLTVGMEGCDLAELGEMAAAGAVAFSDPRSNIPDDVLRHALEYARTFSRPVFLRPLSLALAEDGVVAESAVASRLGLPGVPAEAEAVGVYRAIQLTRLTGARVAVGPLSTAEGARLVAQARAEGLPVVGTVQAIHLLLDERVHLERRYDSSLRLSPPLRGASDREALVEGVRAGNLLLSSGHRPVGPRFKELEFARAEPGAAQLAVTLPLLISGEGETDPGVLDPTTLALASAAGPADFLDLPDRGRLEPGARADLVVLDPSEPFTVDASSLKSPCPAHPLAGSQTSGAVRATLVAGRVVRPSDVD